MSVGRIHNFTVFNLGSLCAFSWWIYFVALFTLQAVSVLEVGEQTVRRELHALPLHVHIIPRHTGLTPGIIALNAIGITVLADSIVVLLKVGDAAHTFAFNCFLAVVIETFSHIES